MQIDTQTNIICPAIAFVLAYVIENFVVPRIILVSKRKNLFDIPSKRKSHIKSISRLGGFSFLPIISFAFFFALSLLIIFDKANYISNNTIISIIMFLCGCILLFMLGIKDDLVGVKYSHKFRIQILSATCLALGGTFLNNLYGLLGIHEIPAEVGIFLTVIAIIFVINAFNFIDGVDGLASGIALLAFVTLGICFGLKNDSVYSSLAFAGAGTLLPFMRYNLSSGKWKIFMGDTGSLTLGFLLAFLCLRYAMHTTGEKILFPSPIVVAWSVLFIPMFDAVRVICVRLSEKKSPFSPDRKHIHHKLLDCGYTHRKTSFMLVSASLIIIATNITLSYMLNINLILCIDIIIGFLFNHVFNILRRNKVKKQQQ